MNMQALLQQRARANGTKRYHESFTPTNSIRAWTTGNPSWPLRPYFSPTTTAASRELLLANTLSYQSYAFISNGTIQQLTNPTTTIDENGITLVTGTISDSLDHPEPASISVVDSQRWFISLCERTSGNTHGLAMATTPTPDSVGPPAPANDDDEPVEAVAPSNARLNHPDNDLCFTAFPTALPVPRGINIPADHPVHETLPQEVIDTYPLLELYRKAASWQLTHNGGLSITSGGPMFDQGELTDWEPNGIFAVFPTTDDPVSIRYTNIQRGTPLQRHVLANTQALFDEAWTRIGLNLPSSDGGEEQQGGNPPPVAAAASNGNNFTPIQLQTLLDSVANKKTTEEKEISEEAQEAEIVYSILTSAIGKNATGEEHIILGTLSHRFKEALNASNGTNNRAMNRLQAGIQETLTAIHAAKHSDTFANTLSKGLFDKAFTNIIRNADFLVQGYMLNVPIAQQLSVVAFATVSTESSSWKARQRQDSEIRAQAGVGNSITDLRYNHELHVDGKLNNHQDAVHLLSNLLTFLHYICVDPTESELFKSITTLMGIITQPLYRQSLLGRHPKHTAHKIAEYAQNLFGFFAEPAKNPTVIDAIKNGRQVAAAVLIQAADFACVLTNRAITEITSYPAQFDAPGPLFELLSLRRGNAPAQPARAAHPVQPIRQPPAKPNGYQQQTPAKRTANGSTKPPPELDANKLSGFLETTLNRPPNCSVFFPKPGGKDERLCVRHCTLGWFCGYADKCHFHHPASYNAIDRGYQTKINAWVASTPGIAFAKGEGPAGTH